MPTPTLQQVESWEAAYVRFEASHEEVRKFVRRLRALGSDQWSRDASIVELFCGRGSGLVALERLGFTRIHGVDLSPSLVGLYRGRGMRVIGDCRALPFREASQDMAIVQGGLHHLQALPEDLEQVVFEVQRILRPGGLFIVVEPWRTPFLDLVHRLGCSRLVRRVWKKMDALAVMIEYEGDTYRRWLSQPEFISGFLCREFEPRIKYERWGKLLFVGRKPRL